MTLLTVDDARKAGFCCKGQRKWAERVGIDMRAFVRDGIDTDELGHIDDVKLSRAIEIAKRRELTDGVR